MFGLQQTGKVHLEKDNWMHPLSKWSHLVKEHNVGIESCLRLILSDVRRPGLRLWRGGFLR